MTLRCRGTPGVTTVMLFVFVTLHVSSVTAKVGGTVAVAL